MSTLQQSEPAPLNGDRLAEGAGYADRWLGFQQQLLEVPGAVAAIQYGGELLLSRGYGFADVERRAPMTPQHIFRIASHSKTFTATAIMLLVEQGKLRLDDTLGTYIDWLRGRPAQVTVRQALNHASGIIRDGSDADYWQLLRPFPDLEELRRLVEDGGDVLPANERFKYSNIAYSLLGLVIGAASGSSYNEYVTEHIVRPLGLADTGPETCPEIAERLVVGYPPRLPGVPRTPIPDVSTRAMSAATGFYSTATDLCRYASAHVLGNKEMIGDASKREIQGAYWEVEGNDGGHYGLGFIVRDIGKRRMVGHSGGFPGHSTRTMLDPKAGLVVVVLTNQSAGPSELLTTGVVKILNYALESPEPDTTGPGAGYDRFTGRFTNQWGITDIVRFGGRLVAVGPGDPDPVAHPTELEVLDGDTLRIAKTNGYASPGETVRYFRGPDGTLERIRFGGITSYPEDRG